MCCAIKRGNMDIEAEGLTLDLLTEAIGIRVGSMDLFQAWEVRSVLRGPRTATVIQVQGNVEWPCTHVTPGYHCVPKQAVSTRT